MIAKEKAIELIKIYVSICKGWNIDYLKSKEIKELKDELFNNEWFIPKECALIAVDKIINIIDSEGYDEEDFKYNYWKEVKQELKKL